MMKSPMVERIAPEEAGHYTELKVMCSGAGWYVGTGYVDPEFGFEMPGTRESGYFPTAAAAFLESVETSGDTGAPRQDP